MPEAPSESHRLLDILIERLYASIARGPAINAYPGRSRQRIDMTALEHIPEVEASGVLGELLTGSGKWRAKVPLEKIEDLEEADADDPELKARKKLQRELRAMLRRLSAITEDAWQFQQDTGAYVLFLGYPLLNIPPSSTGFGKSPRVLAPLAFIPISVVVGKGNAPFVELSSATEGTERVFMNEAVKVLLERQLSKSFPPVFEDEEGADPAREIKEIVDAAAAMLELGAAPDLTGWPVTPIPETAALPDKAEILPSAVIGMFRLENQNMIADLQTLKAMQQYPATVAPFLTLKHDLVDESNEEETEGAEAADAAAQAAQQPKYQQHKDEHLVTLADPSQRSAVLMARDTKALVVHGPPGTGKSQTIANIVGDYLARDKRVLIVCEKRTALDVVKNRLDHIGIGHLCAVVHDATRDRTALFKMIRDRLDLLAETQSGSNPANQVKLVNEDLDREQAKLRAYILALREKDETGRNFTELTGEWLQALHHNQALGQAGLTLSVDGVVPAEVYRQQPQVEAVLTRGRECRYEENPWRGRHGFTLQSFMSRNVSDLRTALDAQVESARGSDDGRVEYSPVLPATATLATEAARAGKLSERATLLARSAATASALPVFSAEQTASIRKALDPFAPSAARLGQPLDTELRLGYDSAPATLPEVTSAVAGLQDYLAKGLGLLGWFQFGVRKRAAEITGKYGMALNEPNARRLLSFLEGLRARILLQGTLSQHVSGVAASPLMQDADLSGIWERTHLLADLLGEMDSTEGWQTTADFARHELANPQTASMFPQSLTAIKEDLLRRDALYQRVQRSGLFNDAAINDINSMLLRGDAVQPLASELRDSFDRLECLLRMEEDSHALTGVLGTAALAVAASGLDAQAGWPRLLEPVLAAELKRRLATNKELTAMDATAISTSVNRIQELADRKRELVAKFIDWKWTEKQRTRLLAGTQSRLNSDGADLRRRLAIRGKNASRVRQVIQQGVNQYGQNDPLFDVCPVWMASPETVAQLFPLEPVFDAVVFDEASQCRLEQGVGVLARGSRVIIAGDTRQLPPTRFFESAVVSGTDADPDSDDPDALFTSQQSEIEDLLTAALNIEVDQSFLEIHYRSSNAELIEFSNKAFYGGRLQALPSRPDNASREPAVRLHKVAGVYEKRQNEIEADYVVELVRKWLSRPNPPSVGIVTFNLTQKDLITDKLDDAAMADPEFGKLLETAHARVGKGAFEGLFVKNLESVQGDERDVMILSCTYGPDTKGKFYRRFGPLALSGGERRLNVIVTRARDVVEVVTSIPESEYLSLSTVPEGTKPTGSWHFMDYLRYAHQLGRTAADGAAAQDHPAAAEAPAPRHNIPRSRLVDSLSEAVKAQSQITPLTYLGTEGFHVDIAFPAKPGEAGIAASVQVDGSRFQKAADPAEWEVYQAGILKSRSWQPGGLWSPQVFRDPEGVIKALCR